jgi:hypothetical protein
MVRRNMAKVHYALTHLGEILNGLSRGLDMSILDDGKRRAVRHRSFRSSPPARRSASCMPSNSPGSEFTLAARRSR